MSDLETFEVSITSLDKKYSFLSSSLQNVGINETFQSLFDRLIEPFLQKEVESNGSYPTTTTTTNINDNDNNNNNDDDNKKLPTFSPVSGDSPTPSFDGTSSSGGTSKIDKLDIKSVECECFSSLNSSKSENGCNVSLQFNVHEISKRHNFLRIMYKIDTPTTSSPPPQIFTKLKYEKKKRSSTSSYRRLSKFHELADHLNKSRSQMRMLKGSKTRTKYKIYKKQESLLTLLLGVPEFKSMYFIFLAGFLLFFTSIVIDDVMNKGEIMHSINLIQWNFSNYNGVISTWLYMIIYTYGLVFMFYFWKHEMYGFAIIKDLILTNNKKYKHWNDYIYIICYAIYMIPLFIYPAIWSTEFNIAGSLIVACEQTRFILKCHSFFVETFKTKRYIDNNKKLSNNGNNNNNNDEDEKQIEYGTLRNRMSSNNNNNNNIPTKIDIKNNNNNKNIRPIWLVDINMNLADMFVSYAYFLFIPMLVYRTSYPRTSSIRWNRVYQHFRDVLLSFVSVWVLFCRFCIPIYRKSTQDPGNFSKLFSEFINGSLPGMMLLLLGFFGFLHSWLNLFAELLRFGDRQFYQDWWNARSFAQYYRKWNCVVHDWIYNYLYLPVIEAGYSKTFAMGVVFGTSSIIHEYILTMGCKFFYPVLLFMFGGLGVFFVPLTRLWRNARGWNIFLWSMLLIGQGVLLVLYSREYYARNLSINDKSTQFINNSSWIPHSIQLFLKRDEILLKSQYT